MKKYDVITIGEALIDYIPLDGKVCGQYKSAVGGAPLNVAMGVAKLGGKVALIGRVGYDPLGQEIIRTLHQYGVDCSMLQEDRKRHTTVTIVMPEVSDMLRYIIYRENGADNALEFDSIPRQVFEETYLLHLGALLSTRPDSACMVKSLLCEARNSGAKISFDVNMRPQCWENEESMVEQSLALAQLADIIKLTGEEAKKMNLPIELLTREGKIILVTNADQDTFVFWKEHALTMPIKPVNALDVTGAGDAFFSAFLFQYSRYLRSSKQVGLKEIKDCVDLGIRSGCYSVQKIGAHSSYPTYGELFVKEGSGRR